MINIIIKKTPIPIAGLMLSLASIGNLLVRHNELYKNIIGCIALIIAVLLVLKLIFFSKAFMSELNNPIGLSVFATFSMGLMVLATYAKPFSFNLAFCIWLLAILIHITIMIIFTVKYVFSFNINKVFATYFIVFVGIVVASVTAPAFNMSLLGQYIFAFGFISYLILLPIILYRIYIIKAIPEPAQPTLAILAAPASLCLAGYLSSYSTKSNIIFYVLLALSIVFASWVILNVPRLVKSQFYASYSALTFPFAITAIALRKATVFATKMDLGLNYLNYLAQFTEIWAISIIGYVLVRYLRYYAHIIRELNTTKAVL